MDGMEQICCEMISYNGAARSAFVEAIQAAKQGEFTQADTLMADGNDKLGQGHRVHAGLLQKEASGESSEINLLLVHAEDLLMSAETLKIVAEEMVTIHRRLAAKKDA